MAVGTEMWPAARSAAVTPVAWKRMPPTTSAAISPPNITARSMSAAPARRPRDAAGGRLPGGAVAIRPVFLSELSATGLVTGRLQWGQSRESRPAAGILSRCEVAGVLVLDVREARPALDEPRDRAHKSVHVRLGRADPKRCPDRTRDARAFAAPQRAAHRVGGDGVDAEEMDDVGMGAEAPVANADAVLGAQRRGHEGVVHPLDRECHHPEAVDAGPVPEAQSVHARKRGKPGLDPLQQLALVVGDAVHPGSGQRGAGDAERDGAE